ncbi:hypothetical protein SAMN05216559_4062 [Halomicrobium zhouii]|uniref:Uncharacterized protein n=1 Tax=Halomicrobium zhouii TaxID=767519 RepID=A0A1I6M9G0_9EURY|nr:hypothetical protein [Halomicrobium zhouii]MCU4802192.1 hypothetical protein [Halobacteria archaeon HArc-gm2]SFS12291.1 hypothetical protein SAMN05216559_4062 [Halomicrobium zhouii]
MSSDSPTVDDYFEASDEYDHDDKSEIPAEKLAELEAEISALQSD